MFCMSMIYYPFYDINICIKAYKNCRQPTAKTVTCFATIPQNNHYLSLALYTVRENIQEGSMSSSDKDRQENAYEFVSRYHFPITGFNKESNKEVVVGTCILINVSDRIFLVTASHVMNERQNVKNKELWLWNYSDGSKFTITEDIIGDDNPDLAHRHDVAIVELNISEYDTFNNIEFYENCFLRLERIVSDIDYQSSDDELMALLVAGYPSSKNKLIKSNFKKPKLLLHLTDQHSTEEVDQDEEKLLTISVNWDSDNLDDMAAQLPKPQGMSGGGVWLLSNKSQFSPMLYAISVAHLSTEKKIIAVKMTLVLSLLKCYFPGTQLDKLRLPIEHVSTSESGVQFIVPVT